MMNFVLDNIGGCTGKPIQKLNKVIKKVSGLQKETAKRVGEGEKGQKGGSRREPSSAATPREQASRLLASASPAHGLWMTKSVRA